MTDSNPRQFDKDHYSKHAEDYEKSTGKYSRLITPRVLDLIDPIDGSSTVHDNGCGPGIVSQVIMAQQGQKQPSLILTDNSEGMIKLSQAIGEEHGWTKAQYLVLDAVDLHGIPSDTVTHSISQLLFFAMKDERAAIAEIHRTLKKGGVAAVITWKSTEPTHIMGRAHKAIRPDLPLPLVLPGRAFGGDEHGDQETVRYRQYFDEIFGQGEVKMLEIDMTFKVSEDELVELFDSPFWNKVKEDWSTEDKAKWSDAIRDAIKPEDRKSGTVESDCWCFVVHKS